MDNKVLDIDARCNHEDNIISHMIFNGSVFHKGKVLVSGVLQVTCITSCKSLQYISL